MLPFLWVNLQVDMNPTDWSVLILHEMRIGGNGVGPHYCERRIILWVMLVNGNISMMSREINCLIGMMCLKANTGGAK